MKKFIALVLAIAMLLSIASVASASSVNFYQQHQRLSGGHHPIRQRQHLLVA